MNRLAEIIHLWESSRLVPYSLIELTPDSVSLKHGKKTVEIHWPIEPDIHRIWFVLDKVFKDVVDKR